MIELEERFDFIDMFVDFNKRLFDAPEEYHRAIAMFLISTFCGRRFIFLSVPDAEIYTEGGSRGKLLNLWFILIGKTRIDRKSTVVSKAEELVRLIDRDLLLPEEYTPQSFIRIMAEKERNGETCVAWVNDEIGSFFEQLKRSDFMAGIDSLLSRVYDGRSYTRTTIGRGAERILNPYLTTLLSSTLYLPSLFEEQKIRQGFMNRFIYVRESRKERRPARTTLTEEEELIAQEIVSWLRTLSMVRSLVLLNFNSAAKRRYEEFEEAVENEIENKNLDIKEGYMGNLPNFVMRIAAIYRISRLTISELENIEIIADPVLIVEEEDVIKAIGYSRKIWKWFEEVISLMKRSSRREEVVTSEGYIEYIKSRIQEYGIQVNGKFLISQKLLLRALNMTKGQKFYDLKSTLVERGEIRVLTEEEINTIPDDMKRRLGIDRSRRIPTVFEYISDEG